MAVKRYVSLFYAFFIKNLRESTAYKLDFIVGVGAHLIMQVCGVLFINIIFTKVPVINGWGYYECISLYGFSLIPAGLEELFLHRIWELPGTYIRNGNMDRLLLRPINPLFAIAVDGTGLHGFIISICGVVLFSRGITRLGLTLSVLQIAGCLVFAVSGMFIIFAITAFFATFSIWLTDVMSAMVLVNNLSQFLRYPMKIYPPVIQFILTFIIPYAFTSFYPAGYLLSFPGFARWAWASPFVAVLLVYLECRFFTWALKSYKSAGG